MSAFLSRWSIAKKLALLGAMAALMVVVPAWVALEQDFQRHAYAGKAAASLPPLRALADSIHLTQRHRGQSAGALSGNAALAAQRRDTQAATDAAMTAMADALAPLEPALRDRAGALVTQWRQLAADVGAARIGAPQSFATHTALTNEQLELMERVANETELVLYPEADGYYLQFAVINRLEPLIERMGTLRAIGAAALAKKDVSPADQASVRLQLASIEALFRSADDALTRALADLTADGHATAPKATTALAAARGAARDATKLVEGALLGAAPGMASEVYFRAMTEAMDKQIALSAAAMEAMTESFSEFQARATRELAVIALVLLLAGGTCAWMLLAIARAIVSSVNQSVDALEAVAAGDLSRDVVVHGHDEFARLLTSVRQMTHQLRDVVGGVRSSAEGVATASAEIAQGNLSLSQRTEQQASSLEETASSMEELTTTVRQNSDNARQANQLAIGASEVAERGGEVVRQVVTTMQGISDSSKKIADIIGVIDGIAFQTNILALNAAVEAARAGEQGRGFAVVASEVRALAQRSAAAAKEIKGLITASAAEVQAGTELVDQAGHTIDEVVVSVKRVTDIMAEITTASQEQSSGIDQINGAVTQMDEVTQQNAALVEQAAAAAESLQEQSDALVKAVAGFKVGAVSGAAHVASVAATVTAPRPVAPMKTPSPAPSPAAFVERRGPNRAKNVTRLPTAKAPAPPPAVHAPAPARSAPAKAAPAKAVGDDDWESF